jgi:hypothetical protein
LPLSFPLLRQFCSSIRSPHFQDQFQIPCDLRFWAEKAIEMAQQ